MHKMIKQLKSHENYTNRTVPVSQFTLVMSVLLNQSMDTKHIYSFNLKFHIQLHESENNTTTIIKS